MNKMKWFCRYAFLSLLLAGGAGWSVYCQITLAQLNATADSLSFIDMAVAHPSQAVAVLERIDTFTRLRNWGIVFAGVMALCIVTLALFQKLSGRKKKVPEKAAPAAEAAPMEEISKELIVEPAPVEEIPEEPVAEPAPVAEIPEPAPKPVFCSQCGKRYEKKPAFCTQCGAAFN